MGSAILGPGCADFTDVKCCGRPTSVPLSVGPAGGPCLTGKQSTDMVHHAWTTALVAALRSHDSRAIWILSLGDAGFRAWNKDKVIRLGVLKITMLISRHLYLQHGSRCPADKFMTYDAFTGRKDALALGYTMGEVAEAAGDFETAILAYKECIQEMTQHPERYREAAEAGISMFWLALGIACKRASKWEQGSEAYMQAATTAKTRVRKEEALANRAKMFFTKEQMEVNGDGQSKEWNLMRDGTFAGAMSDLFDPMGLIKTCYGSDSHRYCSINFGFSRLSEHAKAIRESDHGAELFLSLAKLNEETREHAMASYRFWVFSWDDDCGVRELTSEEVEAVPPHLKRECMPPIDTYGKQVSYMHGVPLTSNPSTPEEERVAFERLSISSAKKQYQKQRISNSARLQPCENCQTQTPEKELKKCAACKSVYYCCVQCQKHHWKTHKPICRRLVQSGEGRAQASSSMSVHHP